MLPSVCAGNNIFGRKNDKGSLYQAAEWGINIVTEILACVRFSVFLC